MLLENILDRTIIPDYVNIANVSIIIKTNAKELDLHDIFDKINVLDDDIQVARYRKIFKYADNLTVANKGLVKRIIERQGTKHGSLCFHNAISLSFKKNCVKLFANGTLLVTGKIMNLCESVNTAKALIENQKGSIDIIESKLTNLWFTIKTETNIQKITKELLSNGYTKLKSKLFQNKNIFKCNKSLIHIFDKSILGIGFKSFQEVADFVKLIEKFIKITTVEKVEENIADDDYVFEISI